MRSGKRNPLWHLFRLERSLRCSWSEASAATGPWTYWQHPCDPLQRRALHVAWRECGDGGGGDVVCTQGDFLRAREAIVRVP